MTEVVTHLETIVVELANLKLNRGDTLVVRADQKLSALQEERLRRQLNDFLKLPERGVKTLILPKGMDLEILKAQEATHG
jgi:hypothetical protein